MRPMTSTARRTFSISIAPNKQSKHWREQPSMSWREFTEWLDIEHPHDTKDCGGYFLGRLDGGLKRKNTIVNRSAITLDADKATPSFIADMMLELDGTALVYHSTFHHSSDSPRYRVLIPLSRDVTPDEFVLISKALMHDLGDENFDHTCDQPWRFMHLPATVDESDYEHAVINGKALNAEKWINRAIALKLDVEPEPELIHDESDFDPDEPPLPEQVEKAEAILDKATREIRSLYSEKRQTNYAGRNDACITWLPTLYRFVLGGVLTSEQVDKAIWEAVQDAPGPDDFDHAEYQAVSTSAWSYAEADGPQRPSVITAMDEFMLTHEIFDATPTLQHIRQAANARLVSPSALLCYTLARVLTEIPPEVHLPPVVGSSAPLNLGVAVVGTSGGGKSSVLGVSRDLLGLTGLDQIDLERNVGSGEGVAETFLEPEMAPNPQTGRLQKTGRKVLISDPRRILMADEVDQLGVIQSRNGSTIAPVLRTALTGGSLGQENATADNKRHVPAGTYRLVFLIGVQPTRSEALLNDQMTDAGTPQRLVWVNTGDPFVPDEIPDWPGALNWTPPAYGSHIVYPDHIAAEVIAARREAMKNDNDRDVKGHLLLTRLKVATALAALHGEADVTDRWWYLAGLILRSSLLVQERCRESLAKAKQNEIIARGRAQGHARIAEEDVVAEAEITKSAGALKRVLTSEWQSASGLKRKMNSAYRKKFDEAVTALVRVGAAEIREVEYKGQTGHEVRGI